MLLVYVYLITHQVFRKVAGCTYCPLQRSAGHVSVLLASPSGALSFSFCLVAVLCRPACMRLWVPDCALDTVLWRPFDIMGYSVYFSVPSLVVDQSWKCQALLESTSQRR
jgi:hypothetical protein